MGDPCKRDIYGDYCFGSTYGRYHICNFYLTCWVYFSVYVRFCVILPYWNCTSSWAAILPGGIERYKPWCVIKWEHFPHYWSFVRNSPVIGEFPTQRLVTRNFDVFFDLRLNKWVSKQWWCWWFETLSRPLWRHGNTFIYHTESIPWLLMTWQHKDHPQQWHWPFYYGIHRPQHNKVR